MDAREAVYIGFLQWPENLTISDWYKHLWPILSDGKKNHISLLKLFKNSNISCTGPVEYYFTTVKCKISSLNFVLEWTNVR